MAYTSRINKLASKAKSKPKKVYDDNYLYDLNKTMQINIKIILDVIKDVNMEQQKKNLIIKRIKLINKLYEKYNTMRKEKMNIKSKQHRRNAQSRTHRPNRRRAQSQRLRNRKD